MTGCRIFEFVYQLALLDDLICMKLSESAHPLVIADSTHLSCSIQPTSSCGIECGERCVPVVPVLLD